MGKIAFVFSGQGAQYPGMGQDLAANNPAAAQVFAAAEALRPGTTAQCYAGSKEELAQTANTQPCLFTVSMAAATALRAAGIESDYLAGFSVGELAALTFSQALSFDHGFQLVIARGRLMQECSDQAETAMVAVLKLDEASVEQICARFEHIYPVNYNCPGQIVAAGLASSMDAFKQVVKEQGGKTMPLPVSGAFHTPFMADAANKFQAVLAEVDFQPPTIPVYSNYSGDLYSGDLHQLLLEQICHPVRWQQIVESLCAQGVDTFIEAGPGDTLCRFISRIAPEVRTFHVEDAASLADTLTQLAEENPHA